VRLVLVLLLASCGTKVNVLDLDSGGGGDGGTADGGSSDGGTSDGGMSDGGTSDGGTSDGGTSDGGSDGGTSDGGSDGGTSDGGSDGGTSDGGSDGGTSDGGSDGGTSDGGGGDTGASDGVDYCHVQWPCSMRIAAGDTSEAVYVWVYQSGVTEGVGAGGGVQVEVGVGAEGSDPSDGTWAWTSASFNADKDGLTSGDLANDEYQGTFVAPSKSGDYRYAGRVSLDGSTWTSCDLGGDSCPGSGSTDGYDSSTAGVVTVP
jgi:hypothetical protein